MTVLAELARLGGEVKRLTRERDGWRATAETLTDREAMADLFAAERERAEAAEAQVERLSRERDEARNALDAREVWQERFRAAEAVAASYRQTLEAARERTHTALGFITGLCRDRGCEACRRAVLAADDELRTTLRLVDAALASSAETETPERDNWFAEHIDQTYLDAERERQHLDAGAGS